MQPLITALLLTGIRIYQAAGKSLGVASPCRFYPSCSVYAWQAIQRYGPFSGMRRAASRLLRCHPWNPGGIDPAEMERR